MALLRDLLEQSHALKFVLHHLDQQELTCDQLLTKFAKVIATIFTV